MSFEDAIQRQSCAYCGAWSPEMTTDHVFPRSKGGNNRKENKVPACRRCNEMKGSMTPLQFFAQCAKVAKTFKKLWVANARSEIRYKLWDVVDQRGREQV